LQKEIFEKESRNRMEFHLAKAMGKAAFLDRDGVINRKAPDGQYVTRWEDFQLLPGVPEAVAKLNQARYFVVVVTNQRCVGKGLLTEADLESLHRRMTERLASSGARIDAIYCCPHELEPACSCRKPAPGMLLDAARSHGLDLTSSWMIGDSVADIQAGKSAGCKTARVWLARPAMRGLLHEDAHESDADINAASLFEATVQILEFRNS
jgi:D-glycero-D-manno-heptose 1,7-bisphosphate phosphatase